MSDGIVWYSIMVSHSDSIQNCYSREEDYDNLVGNWRDVVDGTGLSSMSHRIELLDIDDPELVGSLYIDLGMVHGIVRHTQKVLNYK